MSKKPSAKRTFRQLLAKFREAVRLQERTRALELAGRLSSLLATADLHLTSTEEQRARLEIEELLASLPPVPKARRPRIAEKKSDGASVPPRQRAPSRPRPTRGRDDGSIEGTSSSSVIAVSSDVPTPSGPPAKHGAPGARSTADADDGVVYPVWFGTNRTPDGSGGFGAERSPETTLGRVLVHVPEAHRFGEAGTSFWKRLLRFDLRDDRLRVQRVDRRDRAAFYAEIREVMASAGAGPQVLVYLHGFKNTFEDTAIRAAQIGFDLAVPGATAFFSWPSKGTLAGYPADEATIEASEKAIADFLVDFVANCGAQKVHLVAHSMGNRGLLRALQRIAAQAETRAAVRFGQIFLAAPDVDRDLFLDLAAIYPHHAERTTLYASSADLAVRFSGQIHAAPRAGYFEPYTVVPGIDTVTVPDFDVDALGHGYFAQADALLHDLYDLMRHDAAPPRQRMASVVHEGQSFWRLRR